MSTKFYQSVSMAAIVALLPFSMAITPVAAQDQTTAAPTAATTETVQAQPGTGMGAAAGPLSGSVAIAAKTSQWYKFKYSFDENADKEATNAIVQLKMENPGLSFEVWTLGRLNAPLPDADDDSSHLTRTPVGAGTPVTKFVDDDDDTNNNPTQVQDATRLSWVGSAEATETYFIVVKNKKDTANSYTLSISGPDVSY
ncbi:MAG: hypothetical protein NT075_23720 [Chloroflexi bacterium]|nr:hypothetical protein [Chloroflexota bacterium]